MRVAEFGFDLPEELIAQRPPAERGTSRMLVMDRASGAIEDDVFGSLPERLRAGDVLVVNDSRVLPGRLLARREGLRTQRSSGEPTGLVEVLLTGPASGADQQEWMALVRPAKKVPVGERLVFGDGALRAEVVGEGEFGERRLRFAAVADFAGTLERIGSLPLPPYIRRERMELNTEEDRERYQTVYARAESEAAERSGRVERSAAAPTAGLHFTEEVLGRLRERGVEVERVTLHVGLGTFQPVRVETTEEIRLHAERYTLPERTAEAVNRARADGRRVVAVGTTVTRTLEHCAMEAERLGTVGLHGHAGETSVFLSPGYPFRVVCGLLTNFHLPESTLLMLVSAFAGRERVLAAYRHAIEARYRFFSYGDCMLAL